MKLHGFPPRRACDLRETFYNWCRKYGEIRSDAVKRLRLLEEENRRLKRVVAARRNETALRLRLRELAAEHPRCGSPLLIWQLPPLLGGRL